MRTPALVCMCRRMYLCAIKRVKQQQYYTENLWFACKTNYKCITIKSLKLTKKPIYY